MCGSGHTDHGASHSHRGGTKLFPSPLIASHSPIYHRERKHTFSNINIYGKMASLTVDLLGVDPFHGIQMNTKSDQENLSLEIAAHTALLLVEATHNCGVQKFYRRVCHETFQRQQRKRALCQLVVGRYPYASQWWQQV